MSAPAARLGRVGSGLAWNLASLVLMGLAGIAANLVAAWYYDASAIGSLNQVMAAFVLAGQAAALGVHLSAQKYLAEYLHDRVQRAAILGGALLLIAGIAAMVAALYFASAPGLGRLLESDAVARGIVLSAPGLFFFAVNKLVVGALNGLDRLHAYAGYQALRPVLMIAALVAIAESGRPAADLPLALTVSEGAVCLIGLAHLWVAELRATDWARGAMRWLRPHWSFGVRGAASNMLIELNARVDILVLGLFLADDAVGIYGFAAILVEGFAQVPIVVRTVLHARTVRMLSARDLESLQALARDARRYTYLGMGLVTLVAVALFPLVVPLLTSAVDPGAAWRVFAILMGGLWIASGYLPFGNVLLQGGFPGRHTLLMATLVGVNVAGNFILVPVFALTGAAVATAISFALVPPAVRFAARRYLGVAL